MTASLKSHSHGQTMVLTISNPEHRNALGPDMYAAGVEALNVAESSPEVRSVVITGEGNHFCAGGNLQRLLADLKFETYDAYRLEAGLPRTARFIHKTGTQLNRACHMGVINPQDGGRRAIIVATCAEGLDEQKQAGRAFEASRRDHAVGDGLLPAENNRQSVLLFG